MNITKEKNKSRNRIEFRHETEPKNRIWLNQKRENSGEGITIKGREISVYASVKF